MLLCLVKETIHDEVPTNRSWAAINGEELYDLALRQNVGGLVYPKLEAYSDVIKLDEQTRNRWRTVFLSILTHQISGIAGLKTVFELFEANDIRVISLKGLAVRQVYPQPELRNMRDLDLLIQEKDMQKSIELLHSQGYQANSVNMLDPDYMHIDMYKKDSLPVELHRTLWHPKHMQKIYNLDWLDHIWRNYRLLNVEEIEFAALSYEDELINLVVHLARDLKNKKANLQQLCDIVLFLNKNGDVMDFNYVEHTLNSMKLFSYYQYLLATCDMYLGLKLPVNYSGLNRNKSVKLLEDILSSNTYSRSMEDGEWLLKIKTFLNGIALTRKLLKPLRPRARFLRSIGLHFKY